MGYMRRFYEQLDFHELYPFQPGQEENGNPFGKKLPLITVTKDRKRWVFYYPQASRKSTDIKGFRSGLYTMQWFNPRTGEYEPDICTFEVSGDTWTIPMKPDMEDWCLVVKAKEQGG